MFSRLPPPSIQDPFSSLALLQFSIDDDNGDPLVKPRDQSSSTGNLSTVFLISSAFEDKGIPSSFLVSVVAAKTVWDGL
ncbi:unnamed protein product [Amaranthus hypochondriacus]